MRLVVQSIWLPDSGTGDVRISALKNWSGRILLVGHLVRKNRRCDGTQGKLGQCAQIMLQDATDNRIAVISGCMGQLDRMKDCS